MSDFVVDGWRLAGVVFDGQDIAIAGVNPWSLNWTSTHDDIEVPHPSYPAQRHQLKVWELHPDGNVVIFAAGELSNGVWCFYELDRGQELRS